MAKLWIQEFSTIASISMEESNGRVSVDRVPFQVVRQPGFSQPAITYSSSAVQSLAFLLSTRFILFTSDADCLITFGEDPTATADSFAYWNKFHWAALVTPGHKLSVIAA